MLEPDQRPCDFFSLFFFFFAAISEPVFSIHHHDIANIQYRKAKTEKCIAISYNYICKKKSLLKYVRYQNEQHKLLNCLMKQILVTFRSKGHSFIIWAMQSKWCHKDVTKQKSYLHSIRLVCQYFTHIFVLSFFLTIQSAIAKLR